MEQPPQTDLRSGADSLSARPYTTATTMRHRRQLLWAYASLYLLAQHALGLATITAPTPLSSLFVTAPQLLEWTDDEPGTSYTAVLQRRMRT